jgi:hypothetical protein
LPDNPLGQQVIKEHLKHEEQSIITKECPSCIQLYSENLQLQEVLEKTNLFTYASDMKKSNENKIIEFEIGIPRDELYEHIDSISNQDSSDNIWITGSLDVNTGRATFSKCGKMRELTDYCQINSKKRYD